MLGEELGGERRHLHAVLPHGAIDGHHLLARATWAEACVFACLRVGHCAAQVSYEIMEKLNEVAAAFYNDHSITTTNVVKLASGIKPTTLR